MTRKDVLAWKRAWEAASAHQVEELRHSTLPEKLQRIAVMLASGRELGWGANKTGEAEAARALWVRLKAR